MKEAAMLNKQMDALIAFRIKVENPQGWFDRSVEMTRLASDVAASTPKGARASSKFFFFLEAFSFCCQLLVLHLLKNAKIITKLL